MKQLFSLDPTIQESSDICIVELAIKKVKGFYLDHPEIKASHGWNHIQSVLNHTTQALLSLEYTLPSKVVMEIKLAALLHDMDDKKYFPHTSSCVGGEYPNARTILKAVGINHSSNDDDNQSSSHERIIKMISWVSCSDNGNTVPKEVEDTKAYHLLIPRWADRLEAVGARGVVRCYQYNQEFGRPLSSQETPRPQTEEELWSKFVIPSKLEQYMSRGGTSTDMISHYYDKLLHIARPPKDIVRNPYLESQAELSSKELVEVCLRFSRTGIVDEEFIMSLMADAQSQ